MSQSRIELEKKVLYQMVFLYCRDHGHVSPPCKHCEDLISYGYQRLSGCVFGIEKPFCSNCTIHCYHPEMRTQIKTVMKYSGPRIIFHHPILAIMHLVKGRRHH